MPAIAFELPSPQIPSVVMQGETAGAAVRVLFDSGNASPYLALLSAARGPALCTPTGEAATVTAAITGAAASFTPAVLPRFDLGAVRLTEARVAISPSVDLIAARLPGGLDAVVGHAFAAGRVVAIDYEARHIDFAAASGQGAGVPMTVTPHKPLTVVEVTVNGRGPFHMALDTAAGGTILSPEAVVRAGLGTSGPKVRVGGAGESGAEARLETADLAAGGARWTGARLVVADLMAGVSAEAGAPIDGVLGAPLLAHGKLILDYADRRAWIGEGAEP